MESVILVFWIIISVAWLSYSGLILFFTYGWYRRLKPAKVSADRPPLKISVIVAARNEELRIADLLGDLLAQDYPAGLTEILVVNDRSEDRTAGIVADHISRHPAVSIQLLGINDDENGGKKAAITLGFARAAGDIILITDADCRACPGWITALSSYFRNKKTMMAFGPVSYFPEEGLAAAFQSLEFAGLMASGAGAAMAGQPFMCNGANLAYRNSAFLEVRGFEGNEDFISGDDVFLMHKIKKVYGRKAIVFANDESALVRTYPVKGLLAFFNQRIRWASKSKGYRDVMAQATALTVFTFNFILTVVFFMGFYNPGFFLFFSVYLILKSLVDLPLMWKVTGFTSSRKLMKWYLPFQAGYPFYITIAGILSVFNRKNW